MPNIVKWPTEVHKVTSLRLDPPYYVQGAKLYLNSFKHADHENLAKILNKNASAKWVLTYDNVTEIKDLYVDRHQSTFQLKYSAHHASLESELIVISDSIDPEILV